MVQTASLCLWLVWCMLPFAVSNDESPYFDQAILNDIVRDMEIRVRELANQVEALYHNACNDGTLNDACVHANYDHCRSELPRPVCRAEEYLKVSDCGDGVNCSSYYDYTVSSVRILGSMATGDDGNPEDPEVIQTICFTRALDDWFQSLHANYTLNNNPLLPEPRSAYFGSNTGAFRIFPGRHSKECNFYDPRLRPWFIAASTGIKNVVMVLDVSGSMEKRFRLKQLKWAAETVLQKLTPHDYVGIVLFDTTARYIGDAFTKLVPATTDHKAELSALIQDLQAGERTNFTDAFRLAFDMIDESVGDRESECNTAVLFLTDGVAIRYDDDTDDTPTIEYVVRRQDESTQLLNKIRENRTIQVFSYSVSNQDDSAMDAFSRNLTCAVDQGVWSYIAANASIKDKLPSYDELFTLGHAYTDRPPTWVKPYQFITGNTTGTTVSLPVYDRYNDPPIFLGVAAMDLALDSMVQAMGVPRNDDVLLTQTRDQIEFAMEYMVATGTSAEYMLLELDECELEVYRRQGGLSCRPDCVGSTAVKDTLCPGISHAQTLWNNTNTTAHNYTSRACCSIHGDAADKECTSLPPMTSPWISVAPFAEESSLVTAVPPTPVLPIIDSDRDEGWSPPVVIATVGAILGSIVSAIFIVEFIRKGRKSGPVDHAEQEFVSPGMVAP